MELKHEEIAVKAFELWMEVAQQEPAAAEAVGPDFFWFKAERILCEEHALERDEAAVVPAAEQQYLNETA